MSSEIPTEWYFITPPQSVSWSKGSKMNVIEPYGTNNPYVNYGTTKLRQLSLGNAMLEGFSDGGKVVEDNITNLEACMRMNLDSDDGFASPYVWYVYAGDKSYGTYVITDVKVDESIRNVQGQANRATVDVSFQQVSPYQISSGIDITAEAISGGITDEAYSGLTGQSPGGEAGSQDDAVNGQNGNDPNKPNPNQEWIPETNLGG
jgi:hypothetical protein